MTELRKRKVGAAKVVRRGPGISRPVEATDGLDATLQFKVARKRMIQEQLLDRGITDARVIGIMETLPRHLFVEEGLQDQAYHERPLAIGGGQTISQPYIVALRDEMLELKGDERVLEIGTGSGYQTAILASLTREVFSIERIKPLALKAIGRLKKLNCRNVTVRVGDGSMGWPEKAPFDVITAAAASPEVPKPYLDQLKEGGRLVMPTGENDVQSLILLEKRAGAWVKLQEVPCRFVKLIGKYGH